MTPSRPPRRAVLATLVVAGVLATGAGCGGDDEAGGGGTEVTTGPAPAELDAEITTVGSSLRIAWRVTNTADGDLVVGSSRWSMARPRISLARSRCTTRATLKRPAAPTPQIVVRRLQFRSNEQTVPDRQLWGTHFGVLP